jgi:scyllo-inositol 2-dehydrogenase (NADP+)
LNEKIQCGLSSFGMSGRVFHKPLIDAHPNFEIRAVVRYNTDISKSFRSDIAVYDSFSEMLDDPDLNLIIVNVPDHLHYEFTKKALLAQKHVVVEKPFTLTVKEGKELIDLSKETKKELFVFQNRRWDSDFLTIRKLLKTGQLGRLIEYEAHYDRYRPVPPLNTWKEDGQFGPGLLYNLGAHLIDQALVLFGKPISVFADLDIMRTKGQIIDYFTIVLFYPRHRAILRSTYLAREPAYKYILHGESGSFFKHGSDPQEENLNQGCPANDPIIGIENKNIWGRLFSELHPNGEAIPSEAGNYLEFYNGVAENLNGQSNIAVSGSDGLAVIEIIEAALESNQKGQKILL